MLINCLALTALFGPAIQKESPEQLAAIIQIGKVEDGWNSGSGKRFAEPFGEYADYVVVDGMHIVGREVIAQGHQRIFDTIYKGSKLDLEVEKWRLLKPEVATTIVGATLTLADKSVMKARLTFVFVKNDGKWMIESFQNTMIAPKGARMLIKGR